MNWKPASRCLVSVGLIASALLAGCAAPVHKALDPAEIDRITQTNVRAQILEEEITIFVDKSTTGQELSAGGGACCALMGSMLDKSIDDSRSKRAEAWVAPLLEQTADIDFRRDYWDALLPTFQSMPWLRIGETELTGGPRELPEGWLDVNAIIVSASFQLTSDARALVMASLVRFWSEPEKKPSYFGYQTYFSALLPDTLQGETAIAQWAANGAQLYRRALAEGISETMRMIRLDLPDAERNTGHLSGPPMKLKGPASPKGTTTYSGQVLDQNAERVVLRMKGGNLVSLPADQGATMKEDSSPGGIR